MTWKETNKFMTLPSTALPVKDKSASCLQNVLTTSLWLTGSRKQGKEFQALTDTQYNFSYFKAQKETNNDFVTPAFKLPAFCPFICSRVLTAQNFC
jgi:secreted Zn-dependent insulinase-like peptidase